MPNRKIKIPEPGTLLKIKRGFALFRRPQDSMEPEAPCGRVRIRGRYRSVDPDEVVFFISVSSYKDHFFKNTSAHYEWTFLVDEGAYVVTSSRKPKDFFRHYLKVCDDQA